MESDRTPGTKGKRKVRVKLFLKDGTTQIDSMREVWWSGPDGAYWTIPEVITRNGRTFGSKPGPISGTDDQGKVYFLYEDEVPSDAVRE